MAPFHDPLYHDPLSPPSYPTTGSNVLMGRHSYQAFLSTRSRVIRMFNLPENPVPHLIALFQPPHTPVSLWCLREEWGGDPPGSEHSVWAVFRMHEQAVTALSLSGSVVSIATALETDLEPFGKLRKVELTTSRTLPKAPTLFPLFPSSPPTVAAPVPSPRPALLLGASAQISPHHTFTLSSNPPNPRHSFRPGDWICVVPACGAHNFMRNTACIGCRSPRSSISSPRVPAAPRFLDPPFSEFIKFDANSPPCYAERAPITIFNSFSSLGSMADPQTSTVPDLTMFPPAQTLSASSSMSFDSATFAPADYSASSKLATTPSMYTSTSQPKTILTPVLPHINQLPFILTPSGRTRAIGVRPRNVSKDALNPCIILWPDNEPPPSQGQVKPLLDIGPQLPPIMNTGNKGPIALQPGDWLCSECKYVNWRRRKVCETCYPYADGNSDGVSASVQTERIAIAQRICGIIPLAFPSQISSLPSKSPSCSAINYDPFQPGSVDTFCRSVASSATSLMSGYLESGHGPLLSSVLEDTLPVTPSPNTPCTSIGSKSPASARDQSLRKQSSSSSLSITGSQSIWTLKNGEVSITTANVLLK